MVYEHCLFEILVGMTVWSGWHPEAVTICAQSAVYFIQSANYKTAGIHPSETCMLYAWSCFTSLCGQIQRVSSGYQNSCLCISEVVLLESTLILLGVWLLRRLGQKECRFRTSCLAAGWSSRNTFARLYNLDISSCVPHFVCAKRCQLTLLVVCAPDHSFHSEMHCFNRVQYWPCPSIWTVWFQLGLVLSSALTRPLRLDHLFIALDKHLSCNSVGCHGFS